MWKPQIYSLQASWDFLSVSTTVLQNGHSLSINFPQRSHSTLSLGIPQPVRYAAQNGNSVTTFQEKPSVPSWPLQMIHASFGSHSVTYPMGTRSSLLVVKRSGHEAYHSSQPVSWFIMHEAKLPFPYTHMDSLKDSLNSTEHSFHWWNFKE